jgi:micrococcal nuclease
MRHELTVTRDGRVVQKRIHDLRPPGAPSPWDPQPDPWEVPAMRCWYERQGADPETAWRYSRRRNLLWRREYIERRWRLAAFVVYVLLMAALLSSWQCSASARELVVVVDGDTFWLGDEKVRLSNIDAPETYQAKCDAERELGQRAKARLTALLAAADGAPGLIREHRLDRYGRTLARVVVNGRDVGSTLVDEGLARPWLGHREPWCPEAKP